MPIRHGLLALLAEGPDHGFGLRAEFERRTGGTWPLNVGQVYTTLTRLVRDGLAQEASREPDGSVRYALTGAGRAEVESWWRTPVDRTTPARDELAIKLALAVAGRDVDVAAVVQRQRSENLARLQRYTADKRGLPPPVPGNGNGNGEAGAGLARRLVLDHLIFTAEAEARWLDHVEATVHSVRTASKGRQTR